MRVQIPITSHTLPLYPACSKVYISPHCPRIVLDKLARLGYSVNCSAGVGQTCVWTLYAAKPDPVPETA